MPRPTATVLPLLLFIIGFSACNGPRSDHYWSKDWVERPLRYAHGFQEWTHGAERLLITFGPGGTSDTTGIYQLSPDSAFTEGPPNAIRMHVPLPRVVLGSTTHGPYVTALGEADAVVGCANAEQLLDTALVARRKAGTLAGVGAGDGLDREAMLVLHPDVLFSYPFGRTGSASSSLGIPVVDIGEYLEDHPLGRAEWMRVFALFLGKERMADSLFDAIAERYEEARASVPGGTRRPTVFFGSSWKGTWSVPAGNSYMARLLADAGGHYLFAGRKAKGNIDIDLETTLEQGAKADLWGRILDQDRPVTITDVAGGDARIMALPAFTLHRCFYANSAESDLFGQAVLEPDVVLRDIIGILHPALSGDRRPVYFKPVQ